MFLSDSTGTDVYKSGNKRVGVYLCVYVCVLHRLHQERSKVTSAQSVQQHQTELIKVCKCPTRHLTLALEF